MANELAVTDQYLNEADANAALLSSISDELKKHMEGREAVHRDMEVTRKFNAFLSHRVMLEKDATEAMSNKLVNILNKKVRPRISIREVNSVQEPEAEEDEEDAEEGQDDTLFGVNKRGETEEMAKRESIHERMQPGFKSKVKQLMSFPIFTEESSAQKKPRPLVHDDAIVIPFKVAKNRQRTMLTSGRRRGDNSAAPRFIRKSTNFTGLKDRAPSRPSRPSNAAEFKRRSHRTSQAVSKGATLKDQMEQGKRRVTQARKVSNFVGSSRSLGSSTK